VLIFCEVDGAGLMLLVDMLVADVERITGAKAELPYRRLESACVVLLNCGFAPNRYYTLPPMISRYYRTSMDLQLRTMKNMRSFQRIEICETSMHAAERELHPTSQRVLRFNKLLANIFHIP
jgi:hypothetical protein